jgi:hypothetical protein
MINSVEGRGASNKDYDYDYDYDYEPLSSPTELTCAPRIWVGTIWIAWGGRMGYKEPVFGKERVKYEERDSSGV